MRLATCLLRSVGSERSALRDWRYITPRYLSTTQSCHRLPPQQPGNHFEDDGPRPQPADQPGFESILDKPPVVVRVKDKGNIVLLVILAMMPITAFALGTWQVQRLAWKSDLIAKLEDRILRDPLPLPPRVDVSTVPDFDFRRVYATGRFRHDQEMLIGLRVHEGKVGYLVVTPLEREGDGTTVLVNRGWIARDLAPQSRRPDSLTSDDVVVEGLIRQPWKKNMFTPDNRPEKGEFYFPDVHQMAQLTGSQELWIDSTLDPDFLQAVDYETRGIPIGRIPVVGLSNRHSQYIFTWYSLGIATSVMFFMLVKKPPPHVNRIYLQ